MVGVSETACVRVLLVKILVYVLRTVARTNGQLRATDGGASGHAGQTHLRARGVPSRQFDPDLPAGRLSPTAYRSLACCWHIFMVRWCPLGGMSGSPEKPHVRLDSAADENGADCARAGGSGRHDFGASEPV